MSRTATTNLSMGVFDDGDDAGAGSKTVSCASGGVELNANWVTLDNAVGTEHDAAGAHKANVIKGSNLIQTGGNSCVDGSSLEFNANAMRVKALGIATGMIAADAVDKTKLAADCAGTGLDQDADGSLKVHVDAATIDIVTDALVVQVDGLPFDQIVFGGEAIATVTTDAVPTDPSWVQSGYTAYVEKIIARFEAKAHMKYLKLYAGVITSNASYAWHAKLHLYDAQKGSSLHSDTDTGVNTSYDVDGDPECIISIDISGDITVGRMYTAVVELDGPHAGVSATMKSAIIMVTSA